jgi:hypothetical protein
MLRSLGYSTRVVSGFYARSEKYDPRTRHTPIHADDVHFWVEIYLGSRIWATVEPTPGYDVLGPPLGIQDRILAALTGLLEWARTHWLLLSVGLAGAIAVLRTRLLWLNALHTICWHCSRCQSPRRHVLATWRLLDRRLAWAGWRRPEWCPPREWCRRLPAAEVDLRAALIAVTELADWARFAPRDAAADFRAAAELRSVCGRAVSLSSLTRLQRLAPRKRATRCSGATSRVADRAARQLPDTNPTWNAA